MTPHDWKSLNDVMRMTASMAALAAGTACIVKSWMLGMSHVLHWLYFGMGMCLFAIVGRTGREKKEGEEK